MAGTSTTPELCGFGFTTVLFTIQKPQMLFFSIQHVTMCFSEKLWFFTKKWRFSEKISCEVESPCAKIPRHEVLVERSAALQDLRRSATQTDGLRLGISRKCYKIVRWISVERMLFYLLSKEWAIDVFLRKVQWPWKSVVGALTLTRSSQKMGGAPNPKTQNGQTILK